MQHCEGQRHSQDVFLTGRGTAYSRAVTRCRSALTGQALGTWRSMRFVYCLTCAAILQRVRMTVEGWACASAVCCKVEVRKAWWRTSAAHASRNRGAFARKVVAEVRSLRRSTFTAVIACSPFPRAP